MLVAVWAIGALPDADTRPWIRPVGEPHGPVRIVRFYASNETIVLGDKTQLCYGVVNARSVRISPAVSTILPAGNRCFEIAPERTTHYTILAEGFDGSVVTQPLTLVVEPVHTQPRVRPNVGLAALSAYNPSQRAARARI